MDYDGLLELVKKRRSIRRFTSDPVPDEYVNKILEVARWAPSGANSQPWEFIVIRQPEVKAKIAELCREMFDLMVKMETTRAPELRFTLFPPPSDLGPVYILPCGDTRLNECFPAGSGKEGYNTYLSGMASVFLYMALAATSLGLGARWESRVTSSYVQTMLKDYLGIPPEFEIYDMLVVGFPAMSPPPREAKSVAEMVHYESYDKAKYRSDKQVRDFIINLRQQMGKPRK